MMDPEHNVVETAALAVEEAGVDSTLLMSEEQVTLHLPYPLKETMVVQPRFLGRALEAAEVVVEAQERREQMPFPQMVPTVAMVLHLPLLEPL
jgi:hypothetical protein